MKKLRHNLMVCSIFTLWLGNIIAVAYVWTRLAVWMLSNRQLFYP